MKHLTALSCLGVAALSWGSPGALLAQTCSSAIEQTRPNSRYEVVVGTSPAGAEVIDKVTGLIWKRCLEGLSWNGSQCVGTLDRFTWREALTRARATSTPIASTGSTWRLPNRNELLSLVETACDSPAINGYWFPNQPAQGAVWSASPYSNYDQYAWLVNFDTGSSTADEKEFVLLVRLVRTSVP